MSGTTTLPPARERNRQGIRAFTENTAWSASEALLDRVELRVSGTVHAHQQEAIDRFARRISDRPEGVPLFGKPQRWRGSWVAKCTSATTIPAGELAVSRALPDAPFTVKLVVNPMRTLGHLLDRHSFDEIAGLTPDEFFTPADPASASAKSLDGQDNMVSDFLAFSGTVHSIYVQRVATFLRQFEVFLRAYLLHQLCPPENGFEYSHDHGTSVAWNDNNEVRLDWGALTVSQCEVCWERHDPRALEKVHVMAEGVLNAARAGAVRTHPMIAGPSIERDLGAVSIKVPLTPSGHIVMAIYAKALDRLRVEVRYLKNLPDLVRDRLPQPRRLTDWFDAIREEAVPRVPWAELHRLLLPAERTAVDALSELLEAVADVTDTAKSKRKPIFEQLLLHGSITSTTRDGNAPARILERLAKRGIVEHVRLVRKDNPIGRRYRLTDRYRSALRAMSASAAGE